MLQMPSRARHQFASDNTAAICPEAWGATAEANRQSAVSSYGEDLWTGQVSQRIREIFETDCETFILFNGTAANSLALAQLCRPFEGVLCHERARRRTTTKVTGDGRRRAVRIRTSVHGV